MAARYRHAAELHWSATLAEIERVKRLYQTKIKKSKKKWVDCHCYSSPSSLMLMYAYISINDGALNEWKGLPLDMQLINYCAIMG